MAEARVERIVESYRQQRQRLLAAGFPIAVLVAFCVTLMYELLDLAVRPPHSNADLFAKIIQSLVPLIALLVVRGPLRNNVELVALAVDLTFTAVMTSRLLLPGTDSSSMALFLSLKMLATTLLFSWHPRLQYLSVTVTLLAYWLLLPFSSHPFHAVHVTLGPLIAGIISAVGAWRSDDTRRKLLLQASRLSESEARLRLALDGERSLLEIAREISQLTDLASLLKLINRRTAEVLGCDFSTTLLLDGSRGELVEASTFLPAERGEATQLGFRASTDSHVARSILGGRTIVINEPETQTWVDGAMLRRHGIQRLALAPVVARGRVLGVLTAGRIASDNDFDSHEVALLDGLAAQAAVAIENVQLFEGLSGSEARYRDLFERANDLIFVVEETGAFRFANQAALDFLQQTPESLPRLSWQALLSPRDRRIVWRRAARVRGRGATLSPGFEIEVVRADGSPAALEIRTRLVPSSERVRLFHCIARDVTERRRQERDTQELLVRLQEASRLQSEFVANMSHELRTPLNVIIGYTDLLLDDGVASLSGDPRTFVERIGSASRALHRLVESVLEYARLDRSRTILIPRPFPADKLLVELRALCHDLPHSPDVRVRIDGDPSLPLRTDYQRLYSVLSNLLLNAIKFTPRGEVELLARRDGDQLAVTVRDTGIGISPEHLEHVFEAFRQEDGSPTRSFGGVGLGLAIVRRNVQLLGGSIAVESKPGVGSTFSLHVPLQMSIEQEHPQLERISA
jgi:PAS domain S-box-containing protein